MNIVDDVLAALALVLVGAGFLILVWRKGFSELSFTAGKVNAKLIARKLEEHTASQERIERAVNHTAPGTPPLIDRVMKIEAQQDKQMEMLERIARRLDALDQYRSPP